MSQDIPWIEKYRPQNMADIIISPSNNNIIRNILQRNVFPNLLLYGPPGTGKTTTIINMTRDYINKYDTCNKDSIIHLNASDERGIETIRNHIHNFVRTNTISGSKYKFIILDEVDHMTVQAQNAIEIMIDEYKTNIHFCFICNYISYIVPSLRDRFVMMCFQNNNPEDIINKMSSICDKEKKTHNERYLQSIHAYFGTNIRNMINYIQISDSNSYNLFSNEHIFDIIMNTWF